MKRIVIPVWITAFALVLFFGQACKTQSPKEAIKTSVTQLPQPIPKQYNFPLPAAKIQAWIDTNNFAAIRARSWELWAGLTANSTESVNGAPLPIWGTWWSDTQLFKGRPSPAFLSQPGRQRTRTFEFPKQFRGGTVKSNGRMLSLAVTQDFFPKGFPVVVAPMFDNNYAQFVWTPHPGPGNKTYSYINKTDLKNLNNAWGSSTPVTERHIMDFPPPAVSLKPTYGLVYAKGHEASPTGGGVTLNGMTILPMWKGNLQSRGFVECVAVPPSPSDPRIGSRVNSVPCGTQKLNAVPVVSINAFYNFTLNAQEAKSFRDAGVPDARAGDIAALLGMHVSTKEIPNWTWQTYWWDNGAHPMGSPPPDSVKGVWRNYETCSAYSMTDKNNPKGANIVCFNPYLEGNGGAITDGRQSNCMSCHGVARVPVNLNGKVDRAGYPCNYKTTFIQSGRPGDDATYYNGATTTDFSWALGDLVPPEGKKPPCSISTRSKGGSK